MDFYEQILRAIFTNNVKTVKQILDLDTEDILSIKSKHNGGTVLHYAAYCGSPDIVTYLLDQGAEKDAKNDRGETAVHIACSRKNSEALDSLLQMDAEAFPLTYAKRSPLHCCVTHNSIECIESLAVNDYNINLQDIHGTTALHIACAYGNHFLACWLLRHQADPEIPDKLGRLPVHLACSAGSQSVVLELVKRGVDLNRTDLKNRNVFHYACRSPQKQAVSWELIRYLSENALVSPWSADVDGAFPAMHALLMNKVKIARQMANLVAGRTQYAYFKLFLFAVSTVSSSSFFNHVRKNLPDEIVAMTDEYGYTPLHYAAQYDRDDRVTALISMGADLNARSNNGVTPLHCAALNGHRYVVEILLENQADENEINDRGHNALHLAAIKPYPEVCAMLLNAEVNIFARDFEGRTPLMYLCNTISETPESLQLLHAFLQKYPENHGESKLLNMKDKYGWTALHYASSRGHSKTALELIKKGADVCSLDKAGRNAAHLAVQCSKPYDVITVLCIRPSPILFQRDSSGFLPVHYAATKNDCNIVIELLEKQKCKVLPQTGLPFQLTPLHLAAIYGQTEVAKVIINFYKNQAKTKADNYEDCLRGLESLKINEDDSNTAPDKRNYDPLSSEDNMRRIPLHYAMKYGFSSILNVLMPRECSVLLGWQDCYGVNPLMMACANGHDDCVKTALNILGNSKSIMAVKKQTDTFRRCAAMFAVTAPGYSYKTLATSDSFAQLDRNKRGLIHRAAFSKKNDILRDILKWSPSEVNKPDINGVTPLHLSCFSGNLVGTQLLLKSGGSLSILDYQESAPADWAIACGHLEDVNFLLKHYKDKLKLTSLAICKASEYGFGKCVKQLIEHFPEMVRCQNKYHKTPLHLAAENGHQDICKLLVENGAFMDTLDVNKCTPLMLGAKCKSGTESVAYLVDDADCPLTPKDIDGNSALHLACINDNVHSALKIFEALINRNELNTMTSQKNSNLETLLHLAVKMNSSTMTETFLKYMKRQLWEKDANGRIPLVCMVDNPAIINNMWLLLMELVDIGRSMGKDLNNDSSIQSELEDDSSHNSSFNSAGSSNKLYDLAEFESY